LRSAADRRISDRNALRSAADEYTDTRNDSCLRAHEYTGADNHARLRGCCAATRSTRCDRVRAAGLTGMDFELAWSQGGGPVKRRLW
jgi:hypothetical protein